MVNGELLTLASGRFDALITADRKMRDQQHLPKYDLRVVVLRAANLREVTLIPLMPEVLDVLPRMQPGEVREVGPLARRE